MNKEKDFSKNSIITLSKKAGIKCISHCGIEKIRELLNQKIKDLSERLCNFYSLKNVKTIHKKVIIDFLKSENIHIIS
jgi:hypothetical protein